MPPVIPLKSMGRCFTAVITEAKMTMTMESAMLFEKTRDTCRLKKFFLLIPSLVLPVRLKYCNVNVSPHKGASERVIHSTFRILQIQTNF
jgi:hypothetical protein